MILGSLTCFKATEKYKPTRGRARWPLCSHRHERGARLANPKGRNWAGSRRAARAPPLPAARGARGHGARCVTILTAGKANAWLS